MAEITDREKYLFDLQGFLVIENFLSTDQVEQLNASLDANWDKRVEGGRPAFTSAVIEGERIPQGLFNGMLEWEQPWSQPFRDLIAHKKLIPYLDTLLGRGWHMDMQPHVFHSVKGTRGQVMHGGYPHFHAGHFYNYTNGVMRNGMLVVEFLLTDQPANEGGFTAIPGSHKSNFLRPDDISTLERDAQIAVSPGARAGDVIIFTEALAHGSLPWTADHERRVILYRYSPKWVGFGQGFHHYNFPDWVDELTEAQRAVLEPAYVESRPLLDQDAVVQYLAADPEEPPGRYRRSATDASAPSVPVPTQPDAHNYVANPSFEDGSEGWIISRADENLDTWSIDHKVASNDSSMSLRCQPRVQCIATQIVDAPVTDLAGKAVTLTVDIRTEKVKALPSAMLIAFNPDLPNDELLQTGVAGKGFLSGSRGRDGRFSTYSTSFVANGPATCLQVMLIASGAGGTVWFDNVRVTIQ